MERPRRVEIVGGGLAGLALGLGLRQRGIPVTILEAGGYPRHRVCGEFITALDEITRRDLGLDDALRGARRARGVAWQEGEQIVLRHALPEDALALSRYRLDARLADSFRATGGDLVTRHRADPSPQSGRVLACGRRPAPRSRWMGLKQHFRALELTDDLELHLGRDCYVGLARVESGVVNVCGLFPRGPGSLTRKCRAAGMPALAARLEAAVPVEDSFCAVAGLDYRAPRTPPGTVSLGDHRGLIPPFTGHGMTIALQSAAAALPHLEEWSQGRAAWDRTCARIAHDLRRRFARRLAWGRVLHPWLLHPPRRRWVLALHRTGLLPFHPLYRLLH
jgi:flavin-dependent dehydrogenase